MNKKIFLFVMIILSPISLYCQSDFEKTLKAGDILINGLSFFKNGKTETKSSDSKVVQSICIRNKLGEKITFSFIGKDEEGNVQKRELVIQKDGKECAFELLKGIYTYEILLANKEIFKKGEYKFNEEIIITVKN